MTLLSTLFISTSSSTDLYWKLLTASFSNKLARLFLNILGGTRRFIHSSAFFWALAITDLLNRFVAFLDSLIESLLFKCDGTQFLKVLLTDLFLTWFELSDICVVTLFCVLVGALQDRFLLQAGHCLFLQQNIVYLCVQGLGFNQ